MEETRKEDNELPENSGEPKKVIWTDNDKTKDLIWEAYAGYVEKFNDYVMLLGMNRLDPINLAGLNKYANSFWYEIIDFLPDFENNFDEGSIEKVKQIMSKKSFNEREDIQVLRVFFSKFLYVTGIKNITKEKTDKGKSIRKNR